MSNKENNTNELDDILKEGILLDAIAEIKMSAIRLLKAVDQLERLID